MTINRRVAVIAVGVANPGLLIPLEDAARGAGKFVQWAKGQRAVGVTVDTVLLDAKDGRKVTFRSVQDAVKKFVAGYDVLMLYFSGHGILKTVNDEHVLLSDVDQYQTEAINVFATTQSARYSSIPHVVVISDACRTFADPRTPLGQIVGGTVFPPCTGFRKPGKVDVFYATVPGDPALEFKGQSIFTEALLDALMASPDAICELEAVAPAPIRVIRSAKLEEYLMAEVPVRAAMPPFNCDQQPEISVMSHAPKYFPVAPNHTSGSTSHSE